ncbi:Hypothetical predicted protein [Cloeon dipterum]|uniref:Uncharacterized protein n=1 Tax=Cloeon dipterum TaxID=197152 RepID=A0A8S1DXE6_9INSE|nr:Hypothetical predicted protein [Cloeon dipterum]
MSRNDSDNDVVRRSPSLLSLQDSAINTIVKNIGGYRELITKKISPPMRKILFDEAMRRKEEIGAYQVWVALPYLDQHRTTERFTTEDFSTIFHLKGKRGKNMISEGCVSMEEFLQYLIDFVPNLRQLIIADPRTPSTWLVHRFNFKKVQLAPLATDLLLKMKNLTHVTITDVYIQFSRFVSVCRESQNLQLIKTNTILVDIEPNSIKQFLTTLESKFGHQEYDAVKYPRRIGVILKKTDFDEPCRQAKVTLLNNLHDLFPSLTKLHILAQKELLVVGDTHSKRNRLLNILRREGGTLKALCLTYIWPEMNITFNHISEHCNDLEFFELIKSSLRHDDPITYFGKLKTFKWNETFNWECTIRLDKIMSAPLLEKIAIFNCNIKLGNKESLLNRIRNRTILTQVTNLWIMGLGPDVEDLHELASTLRSLGVQRCVPKFAIS